MPALSDDELLKMLVDNGFVEKADIEKAQNLAIQDKINISEALVSADLISDDNLGKLIADYLKVPFVTLSKVAIPEDVLHVIPVSVAEKHHIIAFEHTEDQLKVGTSNPNNTQLFELLAKKAAAEVIPYYATDRDIADTMRMYKVNIEKTFSELLREQVDVVGKAIAKDAPIAKIVELLIEYAYDSKASDIHIEPHDDYSLVRFRIDGVLHDEVKLPKPLHEQIITRIKVLSKLRTDEHLSAQDGKMQAKLKEEEIDIRVSLVPIVEGEKAVLRLLTSHFRQFGLADLGMNESDLEKVRKGFNSPYGMILSTGPTGSGKSTSMYAILKILNVRDVNIATIEDPVEYDIGGINQIQVNTKTNLTFAEGLRSILRQDPNIIYVGEIRDAETADIAVNSAMTGHLVLSTLHTNDAATSLPRLIDMGIEPFLVASTVNVIVGQRLVRQICDKCKVSYTTSPDELSKKVSTPIIQKYFGTSKQIRLFHGKGCPVCHDTGYTGRVGIFEVLEVTETIKDLIAQKADSAIVAKQAIKEGMTTMLEDGMDKVQRGITTIEEILRASQE